MSGILTRAITLYLVCCLSLSLLWRTSLALVIVYLFLSAVMLYQWHHRNDLFVYLIGFAFGPLGELIAIYGGAWSYADAPFLVPVWLPLLWGIVGLSLKKLCDWLARQSAP